MRLPRLILGAGIALLFAAPLQGATVYSWENTLHDFAAAGGATLSADNSGTGVTDGSYALKISGISPGWTVVATSKWNDLTLANAMADGNVLQFDITPGSAIPPETFFQVFIQVIGISDTWQTGAEGYTNIAPATSGPTVFSYDYSTVLPNLLADLSNFQGVYFRIGMNASAAGGYAGDVFIDNLRIVPEPGSLFVLGLVGGTLLQRRRTL